MPLAAVAVLLAVPAAAPATTSCEFAFGVLTVQLSESADFASLSVASDGEIVVSSNAGQALCTGAAGPPRVTNTDDVTVRNLPWSANNLVSIQEGSKFTPGASREGENGGDREIEIRVDLNNGRGSAVFVSTDQASGGSVRFGSGGVNPNATASEVTSDADIILINVPVGSLVGVGGNGPDVLGAQGGAGTGSPRADNVALSGGGGTDRLTGGEGPDSLAASGGRDELAGGGGDDRLEPGSGQDDDSLDGGPGVDVANYDFAPATVDLAITGPQPTGAGNDSLFDVESVIGSRFADVLRGDGGPNRLQGLDGTDSIEGRGGADDSRAGETPTVSTRATAGPTAPTAPTGSRRRRSTASELTPCSAVRTSCSPLRWPGERPADRPGGIGRC
jgi:Ca2+-binding RTX toxin-like protein